MKRWSSALLLFVLLALACEETPPPASAGLTYTASAAKAYQAAMKEFNAHNWADAQPLFAEIKKKFSYTKWARLSELRIADADFEQEKFAEALREYKAFIHDHRTDAEGIEYCRGRIAETNYKQISDSLLLPSADERDQATIQDAYSDLTSFLKDYPKSKQAQRACQLLVDVVARLVRHELYVARFYLSRDNFDAAVLRVQYAIRNYAGSDVCVGQDTAASIMPDALIVLGETYMRMHRWDDARTSFQVILDRYPESELSAQARRYLDSLKNRG